ncbi:1-aminocyclopropane-1-carboxylate deaminase/D-cysteine desulfhydrase [Microbulbifer agarilyticus]|uniref:1-aminocyclopropane-1-carboxylate deaminase/D-cysteine desulfhydrase n=1 Tax=Microbulbifer agarilyticus TaxID=260552 RepID=UPI001CD2BAE2|nr:pyridoxal-phosphate dependent enzyme [Microbulbifer agarilyticus]MCA0893720.1 pyridoxal-phosphate dependent enzyme [Microbulbifer agarilyticus]
MVRYLTELSLDAFVDAAENVPYQQINSDLFPNVNLWVRRDDLIDPIISGNKAYKLIYNLLEARKLGKDTIATCGGAWSNHIHATAAAGQRFGFRTIGIIRGERPPALSSMLQDAERFGMELLFVSRRQYRERESQGFLGAIGLPPSAYFIPEGGANYQGALGSHLLADIVRRTQPFEFAEYWLACGTAVSVGGLRAKLSKKASVIGVPILKAEAQVEINAKKWCERLGGKSGVLEIIRGGHAGGYAKQPWDLWQKIRLLEKCTEIALDGVYTGKLFSAMQEEYAQSRGEKVNGKSILILHTGGLQGRRGALYK